MSLSSQGSEAPGSSWDLHAVPHDAEAASEARSPRVVASE